VRRLAAAIACTSLAAGTSADTATPFGAGAAVSDDELAAIRGAGLFAGGGPFGGGTLLSSDGVFGSQIGDEARATTQGPLGADGPLGNDGVFSEHLFENGLVISASLTTSVTESATGATQVILETTVPDVLDLDAAVIAQAGDPTTTLAQHEISSALLATRVTNTVSNVGISTVGTLTFDFASAAAADLQQVARTDVALGAVSHSLSSSLVGALQH
jgi:hypothetical protein